MSGLNYVNKFDVSFKEKNDLPLFFFIEEKGEKNFRLCESVRMPANVEMSACKENLH